jgi:hypothetical protein
VAERKWGSRCRVGRELRGKNRGEGGRETGLRRDMGNRTHWRRCSMATYERDAVGSGAFEETRRRTRRPAPGMDSGRERRERGKVMPDSEPFLNNPPVKSFTVNTMIYTLSTLTEKRNRQIILPYLRSLCTPQSFRYTSIQLHHKRHVSMQ